ncbi:ricin-type beta-trefoil lectin domain protein [Lentzea sp. NPDC051838]|uniref:ricin-type beta-trefoil lectin domain protein n=1 Tax=Lentzea sp. NPDC051838 TaxID=3154849 RepID=UPI00342C3A9D
MDDARPTQKVAKDKAGRTLVYVDGGNTAQLRSAVEKAGGVVAQTGSGRVKAAVPGDKLDLVASQPGVAEVRLPDRAIPMAVTSEGVGLSKANNWIAAGKKGAGVKVGIIDVGFGGLEAAQTAGELPPTGPKLTVNGTGCLDSGTHTEHGTNVAEVVNDMAPDAALYLACVEDTVSFASAADWLRSQGVQVITAAVGFLSPAGGRGDGSGPDDSPAGVVKRSREAGILWSVAAGNQARLHFSGKAADVNANSFVEFKDGAENNAFTLQGNTTGTVSIRWDAWPKTNEDLDLYVMTRPHAPTGVNDPDLVAVSTRSQKDTQGGLAPTEEVTFANTTGAGITYYVYVKNNNARFITQFDLFVAGPADGQLQYATAAGSITEPGTSPHVITVGATEPASGQIEAYSGRGPTIDGRQKPDITGFDRVSTSSWGPSGFPGTSAAAAHVAGAAALLKGDNPALDAAQIQSVLQSRANPKKSDTTWGNGTLNLGAPSGVPAFTGSGFTVLPQQQRVHSQAYTAGQVTTLAFPDVPGDTTAVAITVSVRSDDENVVDVTPGDPNTSSSKATGVQVRRGNAFNSLTMFAPLGPDRAIRIRSKSSNSWVVVDYMGYFSPSQSTDNYFAKTQPQRVLDTRGFAGSPRTGSLGAGQSQEVQIRGNAGVPSTATSVAVNITGFEATGEAYLLAYGANSPGTTTVTVNQGEKRSGLGIVPIDENGKIRVASYGNTAGVALDVVGWFGPGAGGAKYVTLPEASRIADTATGNGLPKAPIGHGQKATVKVGGVAGVSSAATSAALVVTGLDPNLGTDLSVSPSEAGWTPVSSVSTRKAEAFAGLVLAPLGDSGKVDIRNERGQTRLSADVTGYFVGGTKVPAGTTGNCVTPQDEPGFYSAFDGRIESGLDAWQTTGTKLGADGCELVTKDGTDVSWYGAHTYGNDYTMKVDWKATTDNSDSGVLLLMNNPGSDAGAPGRTGFEVQIGPKNATDTLKTGGIPGSQAPTTTAPVKPTGEWNTFELKVRWNSVTVLVNGQQVNQYTTGDATQTWRNTFVGLQNDGANDTVRFRNVRIKRDTPVFSGVLKGVNDRCLDMANGDPYQSVVWMWDCHGAFAQTWTSNEGTLLAGGRCLTTNDYGAEGALVVLAECNGTDAQQWVRRTDGRIVSRTSGRCVTPDSGDKGARLSMRGCNTQRSEQVWQVPDQNGRVGLLLGPAGKCLDVNNHNPLNNQVNLWPCNGNVAQSWTAPGDGTLRGDGKCLDVSGANTADGSAVALWECNSHPAQQWVAQPDGTVVNPVSGRCLTTASTDNGATLKINDCTGGRTQLWRHTAEWVSRGAIVGIATKCIDVYGNDPNASRLWLWDCFGPAGQLWWAPGDGTFRIYGKCLDIGDTVNGTAIVNVGCHGGTSQQWTARPDGTLVSALAGRCVDDVGYNTDNGNALAIYNCTRDRNQRWATPVNPS